MALRRVLFALFLTAGLTAGCERDDGPTPRTIPDCTPQCDGRACGPDFCGATCGVCDEGLTCDGEGQCVCVPFCEDLDCGDDGCGGSCGECGECLECTLGSCVADPDCVPDCGDAICGDTAVVSSIVVASSIDDCCHDYDGDEAIDNKAGLLMPTIEFGVPQLLPDTGLNGLIADSIGGGDFTLGVTLTGLDDVDDDESVEVRFFDAYVDGGDPSFDGQDTLTVMPRSLDEDGVFKSVLSGTIEGGVLTAGPGSITLTIVVGAAVQIIPLHDVRLTATVTSDGDGVSLTDGEFAGLLHRVDLYEVLNAFTAAECTCYDIAPDPMITYEAEGATPVCHPLLDGSKCETELCKILGGTCTVALGALGADIDTDDDGALDSMSIGVLFAATGATVAGVGDDVVPDGCQGGCGLGGDHASATSTLLQGLALMLMIAFALSRRRRLDGPTTEKTSAP